MTLTLATIRLLVLALFAAVCPGADRVADPRVVDAIVEVSKNSTQKETALLVMYAWMESGAQVNPKPMSWDALAGVSCGTWQEPCRIVERMSETERAEYWLSLFRKYGLVSLDSSKLRSEKRMKRAMDALKKARSSLAERGVQL